MRSFALAALLCFLAVGAFADIKFPPLTGRVVDQTHTLSPQAAAALTDKLAAFEQKTGDQIVVAIVDSLQGQEIEDYGYQLGRFWGIGQKGKDNGAILIVAPKERKVRIEVGYGLEGTLTDAQSNQIIYQTIIPYFKAGQMEQGIVAGTEAILSALGDQDAAVNAPAAIVSMPVQNQVPQGAHFIAIACVILFVLLRFGLGFWFFPLLGFGSRGSSFGGGGGIGFSGGGGSFGGGGASGSW
jgi:uncharacterized protein